MMRIEPGCLAYYMSTDSDSQEVTVIEQIDMSEGIPIGPYHAGFATPPGDPIWHIDTKVRWTIEYGEWGCSQVEIPYARESQLMRIDGYDVESEEEQDNVRKADYVTG